MAETSPHVLDVRLKLGTDIRVALRHGDGDAYYQLENKLTGQFFRLGPVEWEFASRLSPQATPATVLAASGLALEPHEAAVVCTFLLQNGLAERVEVEPPMGGDGFRSLLAPMTAMLCKRVPLVAPDRWLARVTPRLSWLFSMPAVAVWIGLVVTGLGCVLMQRERFFLESQAYFFPTAWWSLLAVWLGLKAVHEIAHGVVCKKYGGTVGTAGVMLILLSPIAYVDVTSAWRFRSKWQRIATSAAGMYIEFAIAAAAAVVWAFSDHTASAHWAHHIIFTASVSTLLFNANPLMRFDGYYILTDFLDVQNLYTSGVASFRTLGRRLIGLSTEHAPSARHPHLALVYGVLSAAWRVTISLSLVLAASKMFHGAGIVIAWFAATLWFGLPIVRMAKTVYLNRREVAWSQVGGLTIGLVTIGILFVGVPAPYGVSIPAVVEYDPVEVVRSEANGFVCEVRVGPGERVMAGQVLLEIRDDEALAELKVVSLAIKQAEIESRILLQTDDLSEYQADVERIAALRQRQTVLAQVAQGLQVRAADAGIVLDAYPDELIGQYVREGTALLTLGDESRKCIHLSIPEHHIEPLLAQLNAEPRIHLNGILRSPIGARLEAIDPSASDHAPSEHMLASNGGPLAVAVAQEGENTGLRLVAPRFHGIVSLPSAAADELRAGQRGVARFHCQGETAGRKFWRSVLAWFDSKLEAPGG